MGTPEEKKTSKRTVALLVLVAALALTAVVVTVALLSGAGEMLSGADVVGFNLG